MKFTVLRLNFFYNFDLRLLLRQFDDQGEGGDETEANHRE